MLSSKSWRQMSITWAMLAEVAKHAFMFAMVSLTQLSEKVLKWDDLGHKLYVATRERSFDRASTVLQAKEVVFFTASQAVG